MINAWTLAVGAWLVLGTVLYMRAWEGDPDTRDAWLAETPLRWRCVSALLLIPVAPLLVLFLVLGRWFPALVTPLALWAARHVIDAEDAAHERALLEEDEFAVFEVLDLEDPATRRKLIEQMRSTHDVEDARVAAMLEEMERRWYTTSNWKGLDQ